MEDTIADLWYVAEYALTVRKQLQRGETPSIGMLNRLRDLTEKVQRQYDPQLEEIGNGQA